MAQKEVRAHLPELVSVGSQSHKQGIRGRMLDGIINPFGIRSTCENAPWHQ